MKNLKNFIIIILISLMCGGCYDYFNNRQITCTIQDKWVKRTNGEDIYLVQCDDNVYKITDLTLYGKFNSSDIYAKLKRKHKYELSISGSRIPYLSEYPNINDCQEIN